MSSFSSFPIALALAYTLLVVAHVASDVQAQAVVRTGDYELISGMPSGSECPETITFTTSQLTIPPQSVRLNDVQCTGGITLRFDDIGVTISSVVRTLIGLHTLLTADVSKPLICDTETLPTPSTMMLARFNQSITPDQLPELMDIAVPGLGDLSGLSLLADVDYLVSTKGPCVWWRLASLANSSDNPEPSVDSADESLLAKCFPASARVVRCDGTAARMRDVRVGDMLRTGVARCSAVFAWTHTEPHSVHRFVRLHTRLPHPLILTASHFVRKADGRFVAAGDVVVGDLLRDGADGTVLPVLAISGVHKVGLFNPQTLDGLLVVDGVLVSTYTLAVMPETAHALLAPVRALFNVFKTAALKTY